MSAAVSSWRCPQCQRRVPGRAPLCHCGFPRTAAGGAGSSLPGGGPARPGTSARPLWLAAGLGALLLGAAGYLVVRFADEGLSAAPSTRARFRGPAGYPALPPMRAATMRHTRPGVSSRLAGGLSTPSPGSGAAAAVRPRALTSAEQEWSRAMGLVDLPLRKIAADTSVLELEYRPFAEACVDSPAAAAADRAPSGDWLASLKTAPLKTGVTLRDRGATVGCETARKGLVARADALKADLDAAEKLARTSGVRPADWRRLLAAHDVEEWDRY